MPQSISYPHIAEVQPFPKSGCHAVAQGYGVVPVAPKLRFVNWLEVLLEVARLTAESQCQPSIQLVFPLLLSYPGLGEEPSVLYKVEDFWLELIASGALVFPIAHLSISVGDSVRVE